MEQVTLTVYKIRGARRFDVVGWNYVYRFRITESVAYVTYCVIRSDAR